MATATDTTQAESTRELAEKARSLGRGIIEYGDRLDELASLIDDLTSRCTALESELESARATLELVSNPEAAAAMNRSVEDVRQGRVVPHGEVSES